MFTASIMTWILPPGTGGEHRGSEKNILMFPDEYDDGDAFLNSSPRKGKGLGRNSQYKGCSEKYEGEEGNDFLGLGRHDWGDLHFYAAIFFLLLLILHLYLHWAWIKSFFVKKKCSGDL